MPVSFLIEVLAELLSIDEVAIHSQGDTEGGIDV